MKSWQVLVTPLMAKLWQVKIITCLEDLTGPEWMSFLGLNFFIWFLLIALECTNLTTVDYFILDSDIPWWLWKYCKHNWCVAGGPSTNNNHARVALLILQLSFHIPWITLSSKIAATHVRYMYLTMVSFSNQLLGNCKQNHHTSCAILNLLQLPVYTLKTSWY